MSPWRLFLLCLLLFAYSPLVLAQVIHHDLGKDGDLHIHESGHSYLVTGNNSSEVPGFAIHTVTVADGISTQITFDGIRLMTEERSLLSLGKAAKADVLFRNESLLNTYGAPSLALTDGQLRLGGDGFVHLNSIAASSLIGAPEGHDLTGSIHIKDRLQLKGYNTKTSFIGVGAKQEMSGSIRLSDDVQIFPMLQDGASILGGGPQSLVSGELTMEGRAQIFASIDDKTSTIGSVSAHHFTGRITLLDAAKIEVKLREDAHFLIGGGPVHRSDDPKGQYHFAKTASIQGISAGDPEALIAAKLVNIHVLPDGSYGNYVLVLPPKPPVAPPSPSLVGLHSLQAGPVRLGPVASQHTRLVQEPSQLDARFYSLKKPLYQGHLSLSGGALSQATSLQISLGQAAASKRIQVFQQGQGQLRASVHEANAAGIVQFPVLFLGDFLLVEAP